jgi:hypothetical protein
MQTECMFARFPEQQKRVAAFLNAQDSEISTNAETAKCMIQPVAPWSGPVIASGQPVGSSSEGGASEAAGLTAKSMTYSAALAAVGVFIAAVL